MKGFLGKCQAVSRNRVMIHHFKKSTSWSFMIVKIFVNLKKYVYNSMDMDTNCNCCCNRSGANNSHCYAKFLTLKLNFWKAMFCSWKSFAPPLIVRFSIEDNQWSVITIIALHWLLDWLFPRERGMRRGDGRKGKNFQPKTVAINVCSFPYHQPVHYA